MSVKGDARSQVPSSGVGSFWRALSAPCRYAGLGFAGFVLLHLACEAWRAHGDGPVPEAGLEAEPALVVCVLLGVWSPFALFAWRELTGKLEARTAQAWTEKARSLAVLERIALAVVLLFTLLHVVELVVPLLSGAFALDDVRPELIARLSSTQLGVPLVAAGYLCGVGAGAFFGARQALRVLEKSPRRALAQASVALGLLAYLFGSYAVIRCASGVILR